MKYRFLRILFVAVLIAFASSTRADDLDDAQSAMQRQDFSTALKLLRPLAEAGNPRAQFGLGLLLFTGKGVRRDAAQGFKSISVAAEGGVVDAQAFLALVLMVPDSGAAQDEDAAFMWATKVANAGNQSGNTLLGIAYLRGYGVVADARKAVAFFQQSTSGADPFATMAQYELGLMLLVGSGAERNEVEAERILRSVARNDDSLREGIELALRGKQDLDNWRRGMARLECDGLACSGRLGFHRKKMKNDFEQRRWVELAAKVLAVGFPSDLTYFYLGRAAEGMGFSDAALAYYDGVIKPRTRSTGDTCKFAFIDNCDGFSFPDAAIKQRAKLQRAISRSENDRKILEAANVARIATEKETRKLEENRLRLAALSQEAESGSTVAQYQLAQAYFAGDITNIDELAGIQWLTKAALNGVASAQFDLAERHLTGSVVPKDEVKAEMWFGRAAKNGHVEAKQKAAELARIQKERSEHLIKKQVAEKAEIERQKQLERNELERQRKLENAKKLQSL